MDEVAKTENDSIPNSVLNKTLCVVVIPANRDQGVASCNESLNHWTSPTLVGFRGERDKKSDLFIFVLGENEAKKLRAGRLEFGVGHSSAPGPLARSKPILSDAELRFGTLLYERKQKILAGAATRGSVFSDERSEAKAVEDDQHIQQSLASFFNVITPVGIIIHHTAVLPMSGKVPTEKKEVDAFHSQEGFDVLCFGHEYHIAYHYLILPDGSVKSGRPERCQGAHAKRYNAYLGISIAGDFSSTDNPNGEKGLTVPSDKQQHALVKLCKWLQGRYQIPIERILRHSDVANTQCPGDRFPYDHILQMIGH